MSEIDEGFIENSDARIAALREHLSDHALETLAREVVGRLASRARLIDGIEDLEHPDPEDIDVLVTALVHEDRDAALTMLRQIQRKGVTLETLYTRYLAPAAQRLGQLWDRNELTFARVSYGAGRIFELVHMLRTALPSPRITHAEPVIFALVPGERHSLGVEMAAEIFRQNGWDVQVLVGLEHEEILRRVDRAACLILGLSSGGRHSGEALARLVHSVRVVHPEIFIIISGQVVRNDPDLIEVVQPDSAVATVEEALATIEHLAHAHA